MNSYIKGIVIFNEMGDKKFVDFDRGVNIITGDSKTGKSALVEIIDYCLCSSRCTIPKGKITNFGQIYCILFVIGEECLAIARQKWELGAKMHIGIEKSNFTIEELQYEYFRDKPLISVKDAQLSIEQALGLHVLNIETENEDKEKKASLRNMVSYMFQHQNLMASKFALFYRFSDYYKRQDVIDQFPVFAGIIGQEYYSSLIRFNKLKKDLKKLQKEEQQNDTLTKKLKNELLPLFENYYALLNIPFDSSQSLKQLKDLSKKLPEIDYESIVTSEGITNRYKNLNDKLEELREQERDLQLKINDLGGIDRTGDTYIKMLEELKDKTQIAEPGKEAYSCPLCGNICEELSLINKDIIEASKWLDSEIEIASSYTNIFIEDIRKLENEKDIVIKHIKKVYGQIKQIERKYFNSDSLKSLREKVSDAKARILLYVETIDSGLFKNVSKEIEDINGQIKLLEQKISGFDLQNKINRTQNEICTNINRLADTLDFEDEFKPVDLTFDIINGTFDLYHHQNNKEKIYLSEMGSGANWVSCHISLFLSLLRYFTQQNEKSPMPLVLFFDQPSQVYFPQGLVITNEKEPDSEDLFKRQTDIEAVNKMYKTIFDEFTDIQEDTGILPQIIIVDHVDGDALEVKEAFKTFTRRNWRNGQALI